MKIFINKKTDIIEGVDIKSTPFNMSINAPEKYNIFKVIQVENGNIHKINQLGQLLFKDNIIVDEFSGEETFSEVTEKIKVLSYEDKVFKYNVMDDGNQKEILQTSSVPNEWIELEPIMIPNLVSKSISLLDFPEEFSAEEVLTEIYQKLLDETELDGILADIFLSENDIDLSSNTHAAHTGPGFVQLLPGGQCKLKQTDIEASAKYFKIIEFKADEGVEIYLAGKKFENSILELNDPIESSTIKFVNTTNKLKNVYSYAIGYQEVQ